MPRASSNTTFNPASLRRSAVITPVMPPPTTTTSAAASPRSAGNAGPGAAPAIHTLPISLSSVRMRASEATAP